MKSSPDPGPDPGLEIHVVRHGETEWALTGQHTGISNVGLTANGEAQARALAAYPRPFPFTQVLASPRQRAHCTWALSGWSTDVETDAELGEWDYGDYEALTTADIRRDRPGWSVWRDGCPGGESPDEVGARADRVIARLRMGEGRIAVFSHGQFGRVLAMRWVGWDVADGRRLLFDPAHVGVLGYEPGDARVPVLKRWNTTPST